ncbi:hypothetical protein Glove_227g143 [Diversispora epigaea]|uniref:Protein kinase domain-containing protein n=1 Tax=Diversispora epigaea TaxID=1348612 RepID=A0A397IH48_9GLOM|nr:hypothetical protein Glove_227g143 [Diversispora epigaea]
MTQSDDDAKEWEIWRWINYSTFKNIEYLAKGGFGSIWKSEWIDMPEELFEFYKSNQVAFKKLKNSQEISSEFLRNPMTKEYAIVLQYMKNGNLRDFLKQNKSLPWIERLWLLNSFIRGLRGLIHRDLHPGDLGLCRLANEISSSGSYASDICIRPYDSELAVDIFNGLQPKINKGTTQCYIELMKVFKCRSTNASSAETTHSGAYLTNHLLPSPSHIQPSSILGFDINKMNFNFNV